MPSHVGEGANCLHKTGVLKLWCPLENAWCSQAPSQGAFSRFLRELGVLKLGLLNIFGNISRTSEQKWIIFSHKLAMDMANRMEVVLNTSTSFQG